MQFIARERTFEKARRSTRLQAQIPLRLTSLDPAVQFSEHCHTLIVNLQGCGLRLTQPLEPGLDVEMDELPTGAVVSGKVANCVPLGTDGKYWLVGVAFQQTGNIWGIHPAPEDWGTEGKAFAAGAAGPAKDKGKNWPYSQFSNKGEAHPGRK